MSDYIRISYSSTYRDVVPEETSMRYRAIMAADGLALEFRLPEYIEFPIGATCVYDSTTYTLLRPMKIEKEGERYYTYTGYFSAPDDEEYLSRYIVVNPVDRRTSFPYTATPAEFVALIVDNLNEREGAGTWAAGGGSIDGPARLVSFDMYSVWDALQAVAEAFGTEWEIDPANRLVYLRRVEYFKSVGTGAGDALSLEFGRGGGLRDAIVRANDGDPAIERLWVQGGDRNISLASYGSKTLHMPGNAVYGYDGEHFQGETGYDSTRARIYRTDNSGRYIQRNDLVALTRCEAALDLSDIYPSHTGSVTAVYVRNGFDSEGSPFLYYGFYDLNNAIDYGQYVIAGQTLQVTFQSGMLAGRTFDVRYTHGARLFEIVPSEQDGIMMPDGTTGYIPAVGDQYVIYGCTLPQEYIRRDSDRSGAEWEMYRAAVRYLYEHEEDAVAWTLKLDGIALRGSWTTGTQAVRDHLRPGAYIALYDDAMLGEDVAKLLRITGIKDYVTRQYWPEVELSNSTVACSLSSRLRQQDAESVAVADGMDKLEGIIRSTAGRTAGQASSNAPVHRYRGEWSATETYVGTAQVRDIVKVTDALTGDVAYYRTLPDAGAVTGSSPALTPAAWTPFSATYESVATGLILAEEAIIDNLIVRMLRTADTGESVKVENNTISVFDENGNMNMKVHGKTLTEQQSQGETVSWNSQSELTASTSGQHMLSLTLAEIPVNAANNVVHVPAMRLYLEHPSRTGNWAKATLLLGNTQLTVLELDGVRRLYDDVTVTTGEVAVSLAPSSSSYLLRLVLEAELDGGNYAEASAVPVAQGDQVTVEYASRWVEVASNGLAVNFGASAYFRAYADNNNTPHIVARNGQYMLRVDASGGVQYSSNGGQTWQQVGSGGGGTAQHVYIRYATDAQGSDMSTTPNEYIGICTTTASSAPLTPSSYEPWYKWKGNAGDAATVSVGTVTTVPSGSPASVSNSGTPYAARFDFQIPRGYTGAKGDRGGIWYAGTAITGTGTAGTIFPGSDVASAAVGDMYINTDTNYYYRCTEAGTPSAAKWAYAGQIVGGGGASNNRAGGCGITMEPLVAAVADCPVGNNDTLFVELNDTAPNNTLSLDMDFGAVPPGFVFFTMFVYNGSENSVALKTRYNGQTDVWIVDNQGSDVSYYAGGSVPSRYQMSPHELDKLTFVRLDGDSPYDLYHISHEIISA